MNIPTAGRRAVSRRLLIILALGLVLRLALVSTTSEMGTRIADEKDYEALALSLVEGRGFAFHSGPTSLRPPLYPTAVAAVWSITGPSLQAVRVTQTVLALGTVVLVFALGRKLYGEAAATWAAALACFYPSLIFSNLLLLTEVLFAFLMAAAALALVRLVEQRSLAAAAATGAILGLAALTRSVVYPLPILIAGLLIVTLDTTFVRRLAAAAVVLACFALVVAPWAVRNTRLQGVPVLIDTMGGMNLRMGNYEFTPNDRIWDAVSETGARSWIVGLPAEPPGGGPWTEGKKEQWARQQALRFMLAHPRLTLWRAAIKLGDFWALERDFLAGVQRGLYHPPAWFVAVAGGAMLVAYPVVLCLAIFGVFQAGRTDWRAAAIPGLLVLFVCALHTIVFGHPRYRLPLTPLLCVYAGAALQAVGAGVTWPRHTSVRVLAPALTCGAFVVLWVVQFVARDWHYAERLFSMAAAR